MTRADSEPETTTAVRPDQQGRILTVPNAISVARLAGVPVFLWLVLGPQADGWAVALLIVAGLSDWLDGVIARAWNQQSRLGQVLDPAADRLYIAATLIGLAIRGIIPWWLVALLVARELVLGVALLMLRRHGYGPLQVSLVGKTATLCLLYAFPLLFLGSHAGTAALVARVSVGPSRSGELPCTGGPPRCTWSRHAVWVRRPGASPGRDGGVRGAGTLAVTGAAGTLAMTRARPR